MAALKEYALGLRLKRVWEWSKMCSASAGWPRRDKADMAVARSWASGRSPARSIEAKIVSTSSKFRALVSRDLYEALLRRLLEDEGALVRVLALAGVLPVPPPLVPAALALARATTAELQAE